MSYQHGISIDEKSTAVKTPVKSLSAIQVIIGTAPINMGDKSAVNKPVLINSYDEAVATFGYSDDWENFTLCQAIDACFKQIGVTPIVLINVLDPAVHKASMAAQAVTIVNGAAKIDVEGVLLDDTFIVKDGTAGTTTYVKNTDYMVAFDEDGKPLITVLKDGSVPANATSLKVDFTKLDPSKITSADIIGGYAEATNTYKGIECITQVYPKLGVVPGMILAPGWSQKPEVTAVLAVKSIKINGCFNAQSIVDADCSTVKVYSDVPKWKSDNGYTDKRQIVMWPKVKIGSKIYWYSAIMAALIAYTDAQNNNVPYKSPSNKKISISSTVLADGSETFLDIVQANYLNGNGIVTAINMNGWRTWGNNTAAYPDDTDPKDRWIAVRRIFDWWGNNFIIDFFDRVDDPTNYRLIESVVDEENIKANGYQAAGQIAGAKITFSQSDNPIENILDGKIKFGQSIGAFTPAEIIENVLEFDPNLVQKALSGGDN